MMQDLLQFAMTTFDRRPSEGQPAARSWVVRWAGCPVWGFRFVDFGRVQDPFSQDAQHPSLRDRRVRELLPFMLPEDAVTPSELELTLELGR